MRKRYRANHGFDMSKKRIDLYLGGDLGLWVLRQVRSSLISQVFTVDDHVAEAARKKKIKVWKKDADSADFIPSQIGLSVHYQKILKPETILKYRKIYNLHPGYLPYGRGYYPMFWALWEDTPAGATIHEVTEGIDEGPVVERVRVKYYKHDTGFSLFQRIREAERKLFKKYFRRMVKGERIISCLQPKGGTYHSKKEFFELKKRPNWESMNARKLIKLVRCLTFPGYTGLEITIGKVGFDIRLHEKKS